MSTNQPGEDGLLADLAAGRPAAFARLYDAYATRLYRTALSITGRREEAEDAVQEVFLSLARSHQRLSRVDDLAAYLFASLRRAAVRERSRRNTGPATVPLSADDAVAGRNRSALDASLDGPLGEALTKAMNHLRSDERELLALKIDGELTFTQIAAVLEINANTAASRYRYAMARLRDRLQALGVKS